MIQSTFDEYEWAHARSTDPDTSHEAAAAMTSDKLSRFRSEVLDALRRHGPMHDADLVETMNHHLGRRSPSGCRTRRKELVGMGLVEDTGERVKLPSGRHAIVWRAVPV